MKKLAAPLITLFLAGCSAGSQSGMGLQVQQGNITLDEVDPQAGVYRVGVFNLVDFDWDGDDPADRMKAARFVLSETCEDIKILSDTPLPMGTYMLTTKKRIKHSMTVQCIKKRNGGNR